MLPQSIKDLLNKHAKGFDTDKGKVFLCTVLLNYGPASEMPFVS